MSHLFSVSHQPVVGTLAKFPNRHLFQSKSCFSIGNLWAIIEILSSAQLHSNPLLIAYLVLPIGYQSHGILGNFTTGPAKCIKLCLMYGQTGNFQYFFFWLVGYLSHGILGNFAVFPPKSAISQTCQNKFNILIPPSYGLHFGNYKMGIIGVKYTIFMQNAM